MKFLRALALIPLFIIASCCSKKLVTKDIKTIKAPFDGKRFNNLKPFEDKNLFTLLKWRFADTSTPWPEKVKDYEIYPAPKKSPPGQTAIYIINHASVLIQMDGLNILTDPIYSDRTSPVSFLGPKRVRPPGIKFEDLPKIDIVLVSHNHYDHLDLPTLKKLFHRDQPKILVGLGNKNLLNSSGIKNVLEVDWWDELNFKDVKISFVPAQHWSARGLTDKRKTLWGGFTIKGSELIYFAGDTGYGEFFKLIREKIGSPDLALLPIGAYEPRWFMKNAHMNPKEAVQAFIDLKAKQAIGIHFKTFKLTDEGIDQPEIELKKALEEQKIDPKMFIAPEFGKKY